MLNPFPLRSLPADVGEAFSAIARSRASGRRVAPSAYEQLMADCCAAGRAVAIYRLMEEAAADGTRLCDFSSSTRANIQSLLPPEAEECAKNDGASAAVGIQRKLRPDRLMADPLPQLWVKPTAAIATFDCSGDDRDAALAKAWAVVAEASTPVLMRGVGSKWKAIHRWSLPHLQRSMSRAMVRVSPSSCVTFCRESHPDVQSGAIEPPSRTTIMDVREFVDRLHIGRAGRSPLLYGEAERCYLQALAPYSMMRQLDFSFLPQGMSYAAGPPSRGLLSVFRRRSSPTILGRLWVSAPGTVSPLHYDATDSYLCQVVGVKRLLLWPAADLSALQPYPDSSPLARRLMVDITGDTPPDSLTGAALHSVASPLEAVLHPGDVLYFPRDWAQYVPALPA